MKKKGFTLIEIIVCIIILAIIGVSSFVGIKTLTKNIKIDKLEQITDRALQAAEVYIENNREMKNELFNKKNTVVVPLNVLLNEGLLDLKGTTLERDEVEDEYIVATFMGVTPEEDCIELHKQSSWNLSKDTPFYICSTEDGTSNKLIIGDTTNNADVVQKTRTYLNDYSRSYVTYLGGTYRIMYIETDDSLVLYTEENTFGDKFNGKTQPILYKKHEIKEFSDCGGEFCYLIPSSDFSYFAYDSGLIYSVIGPAYYVNNLEQLKKELQEKHDEIYNKLKFSIAGSTIKMEGKTDEGYIIYVEPINKSNNEQIVSFDDLTNMSGFMIKQESYCVLSIKQANSRGSRSVEKAGSREGLLGRKIQLKPCIKVSTGIGTTANPYVLDDSSC